MYCKQIKTPRPYILALQRARTILLKRQCHLESSNTSWNSLFKRFSSLFFCLPSNLLRRGSSWFGLTGKTIFEKKLSRRKVLLSRFSGSCWIGGFFSVFSFVLAFLFICSPISFLKALYPFFRCTFSMCSLHVLLRLNLFLHTYMGNCNNSWVLFKISS